MLDINHIISVISLEINSFSPERLLFNGFFIWLAYKLTSNIKKRGFMLFWVFYAMLHLYEILQSDSILYNPFFYFAISVFFLQVDLFKYTFEVIKYFKQRTYRKYQSCVERNEFIEREEDKVKRENKKLETEALRAKQQNHFLENLSKKLNFK
ncbi:hypothetical protein [Sulfurimonas sp.]|uniref:hypothetical protein n=1 Tax=Sulfurimonas sp. TaxID=2022749 RepID=UPI003D14685A